MIISYYQLFARAENCLTIPRRAESLQAGDHIERLTKLKFFLSVLSHKDAQIN